MTTGTETGEKQSFEQSIDELEKLVERLEKGNLQLEDSLECFERGLALTRSCRKSLDEATLKVQNLIKEENKLKDFPTDSEEE